MSVAAPVYDGRGQAVGQVELPPAVFGLRPHTAVLHEALTWQLASRRRGTHATRTRGMVARSTRKLYRQKGTGRARHGSRGAPIFVGGGVVFGPRPRSYAYPLSKKVRRLAVRSALSARAAEGRVAVLDSLPLSEPKTRVLDGFLRSLGIEGRLLLVVPSPDPAVVRAAANLPGVQVVTAACLNVHDILRSDRLLITREALDRIVEVLAP